MAMKPPNTFTKNGDFLARIETAKDGACLPPTTKETIAFILARKHKKHRGAIESIIEHGLADNAADADALIFAGESERIY